MWTTNWDIMHFSVVGSDYSEVIICEWIYEENCPLIVVNPTENTSIGLPYCGLMKRASGGIKFTVSGACVCFCRPGGIILAISRPNIFATKCLVRRIKNNLIILCDWLIFRLAINSHYKVLCQWSCHLNYVCTYSTNRQEWSWQWDMLFANCFIKVIS